MMASMRMLSFILGLPCDGERTLELKQSRPTASREQSMKQPRLVMDIVEPSKSNKGYIFISYKREDMPRVMPFLHHIVRCGYQIWYDRGIPGAAEWDALIEERVSSCDLFLVFLSNAAVESKWVRREIKYADSERRPILGVRLDDDVVLAHGLKLVMNQYQMISASAADFSDEIHKAMQYVRLL